MKHEDDITKVSLSQRIHELEARMITLMHALHSEPALAIDYKRLCEEPQQAISLDRNALDKIKDTK